MVPDETYRIAEKRIEEARRSGAEKLDLSNLWLSDLPGSLRQIEQLGMLDLSNTHLTVLPEWLGQLTRLQWLGLDRNQLTTLPESLGQLTRLQKLNLGLNELTALPESLGQLTRLQVLYLHNNRLMALPESLGQLTRLRKLNLEGNQLTALPESLGQLTQLESLYLQDNRLMALPESLGQLTRLEDLYLKDNRLMALPESLGQLTRLEDLSLPNNRLIALPESLGQLTRLQKLDLEGNRLTALPESLGQLTRLESLHLDENPLNPELAAAYKQGIDAVRNHLRDNARQTKAQLGFFYDFRPVGQGLFSIGRLMFRAGGRTVPPFTWVHDCGSANLKATALARETSALVDSLAGTPLDLLILSHFDADHISGLRHLLERCRVRRLVLPYLTPTQRLRILLDNHDAPDDLRRFLAGPAAYVRSLPGGQESDLLFIRVSTEPTQPGDHGEIGPEHPVGAGQRFAPTKAELRQDPDLVVATKQQRHGVMKDSSTPLLVWGHWEFCFYNLPQPDEKLAALGSLIKRDFAAFHRAGGMGAKCVAFIEQMSSSYRQVFGATHAGRNDISLVTYAGPVLPGPKSRGLCPSPLGQLYLSAGEFRPSNIRCSVNGTGRMRCGLDGKPGHGTLAPVIPSKTGLLYTGDITLTRSRVRELKRLLQKRRWEEIEILQVPHHGAESSWEAGLADEFSHRCSVFSSARYHPTYRHPRDVVLDDLEKTTRVLVNEFQGAVWHGAVRW